MKNNKKLLGSGILMAFISSLCCIIPLLAISGSAASAASLFSWVEPLRPYLIGATVLILAIAFYQTYKPIAEDDCGCKEEQTGMRSRTFLWVITIVSAALTTFPYYASYFQEKPLAKHITANKESVLHIQRMSCAACEGHINHVLQQKKGIQSVVTSYGKGQTVVKFDSVKVSLAQIESAIEKETGYKIIK